jgi:hypothetical protein
MALRETRKTLSTLHTHHLAPAELERFLRGEASRDEARPVVRHLLAGCPECAAVMRPVMGFAEGRMEVMKCKR